MGSEHTTVEVSSESTIPHNGKGITKMAISPQSKYIVTYSQEDESFVGWLINNNEDSSGPLILDDEIQPYKYQLWGSDFKVSDKKVILYEELEGDNVQIYDMKNRKEITLHSGLLKKDDDKYKYDIAYYKSTNFLTNGDLITYKIIEFNEFNQNIRKSVILIYSSNKNNNNWMCDSVYEISEKETIFGGIINDKLWILLSNTTIIVLDLFTFSYRKMPLEINEKEVDIETISLKFFKSLMVIKVDGIHYIYSNRMDFLIKSIVESNLKDSIKYSNILKSLLETNDNFNSFNIQFRIFYEKPWIINMKKCDFENYLLNNIICVPENHNQDLFINENVFYNIRNQLKSKIEDENGFIKKYIITNLESLNEEQDEYDLNKSLNDKGDIILNALVENSFQNDVISSYNTKLKSSEWKDLKVNNAYILYNETELYSYTFMKLKKIKLQYCHNIEFLKYAIKVYNNDKLNTLEIKELAKPIENNGLKKQWILYLLSQKYLLVYYGKNLLKSAIKQNNIELIEVIFNKTLEYFKENPKYNIHILSIICKNMKYLDENYSDFLLKYYNEMRLFMSDSNSGIIHNTFPHLYSFCEELEIVRINHFLYLLRTIIFRLFYLFWKLCVGLFVSVLLLVIVWKFSDLLNELKSIIIIIIVGSASMTFMIFMICLFLFIMYSPLPKTKPKLIFIVPFPNYMTYPNKYFCFKEFFKPQSSSFSQTQNNEIYKTWNGEAIINFKWRVFGRYYYAAIWFLFIIYLVCFTLASIPSNIFNEYDKEKLFIASIILGLIHLSFEFRQFIWSPLKWISDIWNWFDLGAYLIPIITSIYRIRADIKEESIEIIQAISLSCLLLDIKFLLFFRAFESFGIYFAIILDVAKKIISFLFILFIIILSFAHAFLILLKPRSNGLNDPNNPWSLTNKYHLISDGNIMVNATLIEEPNDNTNLFSNYPNSLLAMYSFLTGDRSSLSAWSPNDNPIMMILMIIFSFMVVVYLMNLFIGLLNIAIEIDNDRAFYLAQKAEILKEIELFYLLPNQRRWKTWFPDVIYYYADVNKTRQAIKNLMNDGIWKMSDFPEMRENLLKLLAFENS